MFDWVTCVLCILFFIPSTLLADRVCQFELNYLESFGDKESFYPRYANRHPIVFFALIALFNFVSIFFVYGVSSFLIYSFVQLAICGLSFITLNIKKISPKAFDYISVILSLVNMITLFFIVY